MSSAVEGQRVAGLVQRLREVGWFEYRTIAVEYRWAEGRNERFDEIAAELVRLKVDVIFTAGTPPVVAAKRATSVIPIVAATMGDPVGAGVVASLSRPGGNVTGLSNQTRDLVGKRLELLREVSPGLVTLAVLIPMSGWLTDRIGSRTVFVGAIVVFTLASALCAGSTSLADG